MEKEIDIEQFLLDRGFIYDSFSMGDYDVETYKRDDFTYSSASFGDKVYVVDEIYFDRDSFIDLVKETYEMVKP